MRFVASIVLCAGIALTAAGCGPITDKNYFRDGVGSELYTSDISTATETQGEYVKHICQQAGLVKENCNVESFSPKVWTQFVHAGMNDIDQRCDAYLNWLDARRRDREPVLRQLATMAAATNSIMTVSGAGKDSLAIVAEAFGLASATYSNWHSRLLLEVNQSTVQTVVYSRQSQFREKIKDEQVADRPRAIYLLRNYLRICMPTTIEADINTTTTLVQRGEPSAARDNPVVKTAGVPSAMQYLPPGPPVKDKIDNPRSAQEQTIGRTDGIRIQMALRVTNPNGDFGPENSETRLKIKEFERGYYFAHSLLPPKNPIATASIDGIIGTDAELRAVMALSSDVGRCGRSDFADNFETGVFIRMRPIAVKNFIVRALRKGRADNTVPQIPAIENIIATACKVPADLRDGIKALQRAYGQTQNGVIDDAFMRKAAEGQ